MKLEDLKRDAAVVGVVPNRIVTVLTTASAGPDAVTVYYKTDDGELGERMLFRSDEATISLAQAGRPWAFDAPGDELKLAAEAWRINLAHLFDPLMAVHTSNVEPLSHEHSPVAAADLSQAIIDPGLAVFSKYAAVLEADGTPMKVKTTLQLINRHLAGKDIDFDAVTRFCIGWYETHQWADGKFGDADVLARAKDTSVDTMAATGIVQSTAGVVRLVKPADYPIDWAIPEDGRPPTWVALHHLIRTQRILGIDAAGRLLAFFRPLSDPIRQLAYRLYTLCERNDVEEARPYNELITSWPSIAAAAEAEGPTYEQPELGQ